MKNICKKISLAGYILGAIFFVHGAYIAYQISRGFSAGEFRSELINVVISSVVLIFPAAILFYRKDSVECKNWFWLYPIISLFALTGPFIFDDALAYGLMMLMIVFPLIMVFGVYLLFKK